MKLDGSLNLNHLIGMENAYPNKNEVITDPPVIALIPLLCIILPLSSITQLRAKKKTSIIAIRKIWVLFI